MLFFYGDSTEETQTRKSPLRSDGDAARAGEMKKEIVRRIRSLSGAKSPYEVFCDWVKCSALALENSIHVCRHDELWKKREEDYFQTIRPYGKDAAVFAEMLAFLIRAQEADMADTLGEVYMEAELGNKSTGQFFTPFHVSYMMAKMSVMNENGEKPIHMNEPSCGAGGMVIATAKALLDKGINYQRCLRVVAQDLDWKAVYMTFVQLSILGIRATVVQGDTLTAPYIPGRYAPAQVFRTPAEMGVLL